MMYEPEDFLEMLDRVIELHLGMMQDIDDEDIHDEIVEDLSRLRDLHHRIRLQFGIDDVTWN